VLVITYFVLFTASEAEENKRLRGVAWPTKLAPCVLLVTGRNQLNDDDSYQRRILDSAILIVKGTTATGS
jgi:hypothetical protein